MQVNFDLRPPDTLDTRMGERASANVQPRIHLINLHFWTYVVQTERWMDGQTIRQKKGRKNEETELKGGKEEKSERLG